MVVQKEYLAKLDVEFGGNTPNVVFMDSDMMVSC
jgi:hypothetical protein